MIFSCVRLSFIHVSTGGISMWCPFLAYFNVFLTTISVGMTSNTLETITLVQILSEKQGLCIPETVSKMFQKFIYLINHYSRLTATTSVTWHDQICPQIAWKWLSMSCLRTPLIMHATVQLHRSMIKVVLKQLMLSHFHHCIFLFHIHFHLLLPSSLPAYPHLYCSSSDSSFC